MRRLRLRHRGVVARAAGAKVGRIRKRLIGQIVILIALLALARKIIVADLFEIAPAELLGLAALSLSLGVTYWLVRDTDDGRRRRKDGRAPSPSA